jgi:Fungal specific transcription factor domain
VIETSSSSGIATSLLIPVRLSGAPQLLELHPEPKHIFKLWQAFAENVNPLTKVIHTPTLQQRILEVSWNLETVARPLEAVMFSVYALAITSMRPSDCVQTFGETRSVLLNRYRSGAAQALIAAELHSTRDLEVLQAFVLFLVCPSYSSFVRDEFITFYHPSQLLDPRSEISVTVVAIATRIGHKMELQRTGADPHIPFFEQEMRLRVWWQIMRLDSRARRKALGLTSSMVDYGDVRMPMNVNDAELHPHMANRPAVEHAGATEMLYCLMKYEIEHYVRSWLAIAATNPYELVASTSPERMARNRKRKVLTDLEQMYEDKYLCHCDPSIPLHHISATVARLTIHRLRFYYYHPRHQPEDGRQMSQADQDVVFESSIRLLQLDFDGRGTKFSAHLLEHQLACTEVEALVYMVSELRQRVSGDLVRTAWALVERMYDEYPQLLQDDDKFYTALADLTLKAWEARRREVDANGDAVPEFIKVLQRGHVGEPEDAQTALIEDMIPDGGFQFGLIHDDPLDWVYWNELPQL